MKFASLLRSFSGLFAATAIALAVCTPLSQADAATHARITLKDGSVVEGEIIREAAGIVWLKVSSGKSEETRVLSPDEISKIDRDAEAAPELKAEPKPENKKDEPPAPASDEPKGEKPAPDAPAAAPAAPAADDSTPQPRRAANGVPRAAVITLGEGEGRDFVGIYVMAKPLHDAIPLLKQEGVDIVVLRINSGGGALLEIQKLSDVIYNEYRKNFRTVAWVDWAISAAAMTTHCVEEIYMVPEGAYGACTGYSGDFVAIKDRGLEEVLFQMEKISARGNHDFRIMRAMQIMEPLSATVSDKGDVTFYQDNTSGDIILNPKGRVLTFNSLTASKVHFSLGTASTLDELAKAMRLPEVEWVGVKKPGYLWPICKAEQYQMDFRDKTAKDEQQLVEYRSALNAILQMASGNPDPETKAKLAGKAREMLNKIVSAYNNNPNFALFKFNILPDHFKEEWIEPTEKKIKDLSKKEKK